MPLCLPGLPDGNSTRIYKRKCKEPVKNGTVPLKNGTAPLKNETAPHHLALQGVSPRGEAAKRLTIFAEKNEGTEFFFRQGEDMQRPLQSAEADSFPDGKAGNEG